MDSFLKRRCFVEDASAAWHYMPIHQTTPELAEAPKIGAVFVQTTDAVVTVDDLYFLVLVLCSEGSFILSLVPC